MKDVQRKSVYFSVGITALHASRGQETRMSWDRCSDVPIVLSCTENL